MKHKFFTLCFLVCLLNLYSSVLGSTTPSVPDLSITAPNPKLAAHVSQICGQACPELERLIGSAPQQIKLVVAGTDREFAQRVDELDGPRWAAGLAVPAKRFILLRSPSQLTDLNTFRSVLIHELTHIYLYQALGRQKKLPLWLEEGLAMHAAKQGGLGLSGIMAKGVLLDQLIPFADLATRFPGKSEEAGLAYAQSFYLISHILDKHGAKSIPRLIRAMIHAKDISGALHQVLGQGLVALEADFTESMNSRFSWLAVLTAAGALWMLVALVAAVGLVARRRDQVRRIKAMVDGDEENDAREEKNHVQKGTRSSSRQKILAEAGLDKRRDP